MTEFEKRERSWDQKLKIDTIGRDDSQEDAYHYPYEPTPYCVLERLAESGNIDGEHTVVDYGCGKGRVGFYLHRQLGCRTVGVEFDELICGQAVQNKQRGGYGEAVSLVCANAESYVVEAADRFYFFNPFSVEILRSVIGRILDSYYEDPREMLLFFYYPNDEYVAHLMTEPELSFVDEIDCGDLFPGKDARERILIFEVCG